MFKSFLMALSTLTIVPIPYRLYENANCKQSSHFFPLVGLFIASLMAFTAIIMYKNFSTTFSALVILFFSVAISCAFHLDGLADCADAFWSSRTQERKLEIMKDSHIGVMGVLALIFLLGSKYIYLERLMQSNSKLIFATVFTMILAGRCAMNFHMFLISPQKKGLGQAFWNRKSCSIGLIVFLSVLLIVHPLKETAILLLVFILTNFLWAFYVKKNISSGTGDTLGAACEISELILLISYFELLPLFNKISNHL
jgi:adenosylcobinamide-GDP ribazoletransferase